MFDNVAGMKVRDYDQRLWRLKDSVVTTYDTMDDLIMIYVI